MTGQQSQQGVKSLAEVGQNLLQKVSTDHSWHQERLGFDVDSDKKDFLIRQSMASMNFFVNKGLNNHNCYWCLTAEGRNSDLTMERRKTYTLT